MNVHIREEASATAPAPPLRDCPSSARLRTFWRSLPLTYRCEEQNSKLLDVEIRLYLPPSRTQAIHGTTHGFIGKSHEGIDHEPF